MEINQALSECEISDADASEIGSLIRVELFFDLNLLDLTLHETTLDLNKQGGGEAIWAPPPIRKARITNWSPPFPADMKARLGAAINAGLHPMSDITDYSQGWVDKTPFFSDVFPRDEFLLFSWNLR